MNMLNQKIKLNNGVEIPTIGLGTWLVKNEDVTEVVLNGLKVGYRHIDTAESYQNEKGVGEAIRRSGIPRKDIFVTTKLRGEIKNYEEAKKAIQQSLDDLNIEYIDLMIIHCPQPWVNFRNDHHYEEGNLAAWKALEEFYYAGKLKAIGVSNFLEIEIENILKHGKVKPAVNQILTHIKNTPFELIEYCQKNGIVVEAYSPNGHAEIFNEQPIIDMAQKYKVSIPQLCIRYTIQLGLVTLPKSSNPEHMKENADVDFIISDKDMNALKKLERIKTYGKSMIYKGLEMAV